MITPNPCPTPLDTETRAVKRCSNVIGFMLLAMLAAQYALKIAVQLGWLNPLLALATTYETAMLLDMAIYVLFLAVPSVTVALCFGYRHNPFPSKRVSGRVWLTVLPGGLALAVLANLVTGWLLSWMTALGIPEPQLPDTVLPTASGLLLSVLATAVLPALIEELIFRGYILQMLRRHGDGIAIVFSAALFGFFHGNIRQIPFAFILGLVLGYAVVQTDSIWPAVALHFGNNLMSVLITFFRKCFPDYGVPISTLTLLAVTALGAIALTVWRRQPTWAVPVGNGVSLLRPRERVRQLVFAPVMVAALVMMVVEVAESIGSSFV